MLSRNQEKTTDRMTRNLFKANGWHYFCRNKSLVFSERFPAVLNFVAEFSFDPCFAAFITFI